MALIVLILFLVSGLADGLRDLLNYRHSKSIFNNRPKNSFWGTESWKRKYKQPLEPAPNSFYYKIAKLNFREAWLSSATFTASFTEGKKLAKLIRNTSIYSAYFITIYSLSISCPVYWVLCCYLMYKIGFSLAYYLLFTIR